MLLKDLQQLGFTKNLSTIYLVLFELGEVKAGQIVRKTGMHRNIVYRALEELEEKKLITKSQVRGVARYKALNPTRLMGEVASTQKLAEQIIEELKATHSVTAQEVIVYEGKEEMRAKMRDIYDSMYDGEGMYVLGGTSSKWFDIMGERCIEGLLEIQKQKQFFIHLVGGALDQNEQTFQDALGDLIQYKVSGHITSVTNETIILGDRIILLIFVEPYTTVEIVNPAVARSYKEYFNLLWGSNTITLRGEEGVRTFLKDTLNFKKGYFIGGNGGLAKIHPEQWKWYKRARIEHEVTWYDLVDPGGGLPGIESGTLVNDDPYYEMKVLPPAVASPLVLYIYGNKVANIVWRSSEDTVITIMEDQELADGYRKYHQYLWNQEVTTFSGWDQITHLFNTLLIEELNLGDRECVIGGGYGVENTAIQVSNLFLQHNKALIDKGVQKHGLFFEQHAVHYEEQIKSFGEHAFEYVQTRYLPESYSSPVETHVFKNKVVISYFGKDPVSTVYERPEIVQSFQKQFDLLWNQEVRTYTGWDQLENLFFDIILPNQQKGHREEVIAAGYDKATDTKRFKDFWLRYNEASVKNGCNIKLVQFERFREPMQKELALAGDDGSHMAVRYLPDAYDRPMETYIYKEKAVLVVWGDEPVATVYERSDVIEGFRAHFELLWDIATE